MSWLPMTCMVASQGALRFDRSVLAFLALPLAHLNSVAQQTTIVLSTCSHWLPSGFLLTHLSESPPRTTASGRARPVGETGRLTCPEPFVVRAICRVQRWTSRLRGAASVTILCQRGRRPQFDSFIW